MELIPNWSLDLPDEKEKRDRAKQATAKKKASEETIDEAFDRIGGMSLDDKEKELYDLARSAFAGGEIGRLRDGALTKGEVLSMGGEVKRDRKEKLRKTRIRETIASKPDNFYILTKDNELEPFVNRLRQEVLLQKEKWSGRWDILGVESMTAGDFEGTGVDSYMDLSIGFSIWLPILDEGYYLPYGHVDTEDFDIPRDYAYNEGDPQLTRSKVLESIVPYLSHPKHGKSFHMGSARYDLHIAENDGYTIRGSVWDSLDAMRHMSEHLDKYGLKPLTDRYKDRIGVEGDVFTFEDLFGNCSPAPYGTEIVGIYAIKDVLYGWRLTEWQFETMAKIGRLLESYAMIDSKLPEVDVFMARCGFVIDLDELKVLDGEFTAKIEEARANVFTSYQIDKDFLHKMSLTINGKKINKWLEVQGNKKKRAEDRLKKFSEIAKECVKEEKTHLKKYKNALESIEKARTEIEELGKIDVRNAPDYIHSFEFTNGNHIGYLIYDHLQIEDKTPRVKKGKKRSTSSDIMEIYYKDEEALRPLATVAGYEKLLNTYVRKIPESMEIDGRLHSEFKAGGTATGRYSSSAYSGRPIDLLDDLLSA